MDGTIYLEDELFPYTKDFLDRCLASSRDFLFFTNNSSKSQQSYLQKLQRLGIQVTAERMLLSTQVLIAFLQRERPGKRVWVAGTADLLAEFRAAGIEPLSSAPEIAIIGFDTELTYDKLLTLHRAVQSGAEFFGVNMDLVCPVAGGEIPDCGSLARVIASSTGVEPVFFGKPSPHALDFICRQTGYAAGELCFVGDRLYTDIAIATGTQAVSVLVLSGESKAEDLQRYPQFVPSLVVQDLAELSDYLHPGPG